jgi:chromosome segregation ATPase
MDDFSYVVDIGFKDLPSATAAEDYVLRAYANSLDATRTENDVSEEEVASITANSFFSSLNNLINQNQNSLAGLRSQIQRLTEENEFYDSAGRERDAQIDEQFIEMELKDSLIAQKDAEIQQLRQSLQSLATATTSSMRQLEELTRQQTAQLVNTMNIITNNTGSNI